LKCVIIENLLYDQKPENGKDIDDKIRPAGDERREKTQINFLFIQEASVRIFAKQHEIESPGESYCDVKDIGEPEAIYCIVIEIVDRAERGEDKLAQGIFFPDLELDRRRKARGHNKNRHQK